MCFSVTTDDELGGIGRVRMIAGFQAFTEIRRQIGHALSLHRWWTDETLTSALTNVGAAVLVGHNGAGQAAADRGKRHRVDRARLGRDPDRSICAGALGEGQGRVVAGLDADCTPARLDVSGGEKYTELDDHPALGDVLFCHRRAEANFDPVRLT